MGDIIVPKLQGKEKTMMKKLEKDDNITAIWERDEACDRADAEADAAVAKVYKDRCTIRYAIGAGFTPEQWQRMYGYAYMIQGKKYDLDWNEVE